ncbi:hypothetical protein [Verrucomicrobium spinosum]|uniref:hypothetical protein n=1 Tax=Verrucomicrobium spinosum TaxID=2736 RepID=UPI0031B57A89
MCLSLTNIAAIGCGQLHSLAVGADGSVWSWGSNSTGQLGRTTGSTSSPGIVPKTQGVVQVAGGGSFSMALKEDGSVITWGPETLLHNARCLVWGTVRLFHRECCPASICPPQCRR